MGPDVATTAFKPQPLDALGPSPEPLAAFLSSPDDWSWPHFLDRVASMLVQAEYHMPNVTAYIVNKPLVPAVADAWDALPFTALRRVRGTGRMAARRLLFPCRTPLVHPYLALRLSELLLHAAGVGRRADLPPVADKKVVLMLHRDESSRNGGRQLVNRQEVEAAVRELLRRRGRGETLRTFRLADYSGGLLEVVRFMSMQVRAAIGVHGAAMHNMRFTGPGTLWVEILPVEPAAGPGGLATMYWELAACLGQHYWAVPAKVVSEESDVAVEPGLLVQLLGNALDSPADPRGATVKPAYPWRQARRKPQSPSAALLMSGP